MRLGTRTSEKIMRQFTVDLPLLGRMYPVTVMPVATLLMTIFCRISPLFPGLYNFILNFDHNMMDDSCDDVPLPLLSNFLCTTQPMI